MYLNDALYLNKAIIKVGLVGVTIMGSNATLAHYILHSFIQRSAGEED